MRPDAPESSSKTIRRLFLVGTDTDCGKTAVTCALLRSARAGGLTPLPFKPAASGPEGPASDPARLLRAAEISELELPLLCPMRYEPPLAPGIADEPARFLDATPPTPERAPIERALAALNNAELRHRPDVTLIEGAGGLHVPMPGGTWLPEWLTAFAATPIVVGRLGLGTINHTLLTIDALRAAGHEPPGFLLSQTRDPGVTDDPSRSDNPRIIERARGLPCLGVLPYIADESTRATEPEPARAREWHAPTLWSRLIGAG